MGLRMMEIVILALILMESWRAIKELGLPDECSLEEVEAAAERGSGLLREARRARPAPFLDDKIIVAWNGLMINAFAKAAQVLGDKGLGYLEAGTKAAQFIRSSTGVHTTSRLIDHSLSSV
ncbi:unnamed protein product [Chrysoparadoxa australica]